MKSDFEQLPEVTHCKALYFVTGVQTCTEMLAIWRAEEHGG